MFSAEKFDASTLNWVKGEIDETLKQARIALEAYVENSDDQSQLQSCVSYLHQVAGTLQMVELQGSAQFASEVEQVAIALEKGEVSDREHGFEVLMRAILQLPDYLESLLGSGADNPIVLLPLMNELRESRGDKPLSEAIFFNPDLSVMPMAPAKPLPIDASMAARKLRPFYQAALLKVLRNEPETGQLKVIATVLDKLYSIVVQPQTLQWLWVSSGFLEGLRDGSIEINNAHKLLLGKIDQLLKQLAEAGEAGMKHETMVLLIRTMLFQVAKASSSATQIRELRDAFHLDFLVPASVQSGQALLGGFNAELKRTVSADILEELARVKETFDIFVRGDHRDVSGLTGIADSLGTMAETLVLLRQDVLSDELRTQSSVLHRIVRGDVKPDDTTLMGVASTILSVESTLSDWGNASPVEKADDASGQVPVSEVGPLAEAEHARVVRQVMKEARDGVIKVREAISQYLEHPEDKSVLAGIPAQLHEITGGLTMLSYRRVAQVLRACGLFITHELIKGHALPKPEKLDALADAIMSIEYYLEAFVQSRVHPASVLDVAEHGVAGLGYSVDSLPEQADTDFELETAEAIELTAAEPVQVQLPVPAVREAVTKAPQPTPAVSFNAEVDDEILEIFIEESQEEVAKIETLLAKWSRNPDDEEALRDLRRCFHTLKGSGRLVGALTLGEFAWAFENMLNRVIDGSVRPGPAMFDMLDQAREALPQLIANFQTGAALGDEIEMLRQSAHEIIQAGGMQPPPSTAIPVVTETTATASQAAAETLRLELDPVLLEIYEKETEGHLEQIAAFIESYKSGSHRVNEPLIRALHTLTGSSRMAGVMSVSEVSSLLEKYAKTIQIERMPFTDEGVDLLGACIDYTRKVLVHLQDGENNPLPENRELVARAAALYATVMHAEESVAARPEEGLASIPEMEATFSEAQAGVDLTLPVAEVESIEPPAARVIELTGAVDLEKAFEILDTPATSTPAVEPVQHHEVPPSQPAVRSSKPALTLVEEYDQDLMDVFLEEGSDILNASEETLQAWVKNPNDRSLVEMLQRHLHTLKGGARMAGITAIGDLSHSLETTFEAVVEGRLSRSKRMTDLLQLAHDRLVVMLEQVRNRQPLSGGDDLIKEIYQLGRGETAEQPQEAAAPVIREVPSKAEQPPAQIAANLSGVDPLELLMQTGKERIDRIASNVAVWSRSPDEIALMHAIKQDSDLLMQEAGAAVVVELTELAKAVSDLLRAVDDGHVPISEKVFTLLSASSERLAHIFGQLTRRVSLSNGLYLVANVSELIKASIAEQQREVEAAAAQEAVAVTEPERGLESAELAENRRQGARVQHEMVRVRADLLDNMVNYAGEVSIYRSRVEQQLGAIRFNIGDLDQTVIRLRDQVRQFDIETEAQIDSRYREAEGQEYEEFDPLEFDRFTHMQQLSRSMMESLNDLLSIEEMMLNLSRESETLLLQQSRVNTELQETLMHTRMVPLVEHAPRLRRIVRQTCAELKKEATLSFKGADVEMDRNVVERILAPIEHMLRNSVAHGIESAQRRLAANKPAEGSIVIALAREGSEVVIRVSDDGGGINLPAVRNKAIEKGLMAPDARLSDKEVMHFILESGFSTAEALSQIAGRGVGMDVVASEIKQLGGILEIDSEAGKGTRFTIRLPLTLSVSRALLVNAGEDIYAIPLLSITGIERISKEELDQLLATENPQYRWIGQEFDLLHLSRALNVTTVAPAMEGEKISLLLAQSGENRVALAVDGLVGSREIVVKSLGPQLSSLQDISGATILADGHVALIIDLPALIRRGLARRGGAAVAEVAQEVVEAVPTVMVVDDSITVRKVTERLLKRHNMRCVTAKDGVDALAVLEDVTPDVMLLDIEMPRMDGYELATHIRNSARFHKLPIIMITSRTGEKHRQRAMEIGVNIYMGKPYTEADLLDNIEQLLKQRSHQAEEQR